PRGVVALQVEVQTRQAEEQRGVARLRLSRQLQARDGVLQVARMQQYARLVDPSRCFSLRFVVVLLFLRQLGKPCHSRPALRRLSQAPPAPCELNDGPRVFPSTQLPSLSQPRSRLFQLTQTIQRGAQPEVSVISLRLRLYSLP